VSEILKEDKSGFRVFGGVAIRRLLLDCAQRSRCGYVSALLKISIPGQADSVHGYFTGREAKGGEKCVDGRLLAR
jgi:hypothetical protein